MPPRARIFVLCVVSEDKSKMRDNQNKNKNPCGGEIFRTRPDRPLGPLSLLYNVYRVSFPGAKRPGRGVTAHPIYRRG